MKKILFTLILLLFPVSVLAESSDTITIDFGKIKYYDDITIIQNTALYVLEENDIIYWGHTDNYGYIANSSDKKLVKCDWSNNDTYSVMPGVTSADNITYTITDADRNANSTRSKMLSGKNKIVVKYDGTYQAKKDCNVYYYDIAKTINETPYALIDNMDYFNRYGIANLEYLSGDSIVKISKNKKLLATVDFNNVSVEIPRNVTQNDNISVDLAAIDSIIEKKLQKEELLNEINSSCQRINLLFAKENVNSLIKITGVEYLDKSAGASVIEVPTYNQLNINSDVTFTEENDFVKYRLIITNNDKEDYKMSLDSADTKYVEYRLETESGTNIAKANSDTAVILTIKYKGAPASEFIDGYFKASKSLRINMTTKGANVIINPKTGGIILIVALIVTLLVISLFVIKNKKVQKNLLITILGLLIIVPGTVLALKELSMTVNSNIMVPSPEIKNRLYINNTEANLINDACWHNVGLYYDDIMSDGTTQKRIGDTEYIEICIGDNDISLYGEYTNSKLKIYDIFYDQDSRSVTMNGQTNKPLALMDFIEKYYNDNGLPNECDSNQAEVLDGGTRHSATIDPNIQYK